MSCLQYILEINSKLGHQHTRWSGEFCFVAVLARFKKWKTWLFSALCKIFTGCYFNGTIIHLFYKKNRGYLSHQDSSPGKEVRYQEVKQKGSSQSSRPLFLFCFVYFYFSFSCELTVWSENIVRENNYKQIVSGQKVEI